MRANDISSFVFGTVSIESFVMLSNVFFARTVAILSRLTLK